MTPNRRRLLHLLAVAAPAALLPRVSAATVPPLLKPDEPDAKAKQYVEDGSKASGIPLDARCSNCALYQGADGSTRGGCTLFPNRDVLAAGACAAWAPMM